MALAKCVFRHLIPMTRGHRCAPHGHESMEIVFSKGAAGKLYQGKDVLAYENQSVFVYQPGKQHWVENEKDGEHICIGVVGCGADLVDQGVWKATPDLVSHFEEIHQNLVKGDRLQTTRLDLLSGLVVCDLLAQQPSRNLSPPNRAQQARDIIENEITTSLSLDALAQRLQVSRDYLRGLFRKEFEESINSYITRRRIELAAQLLQATDTPVKAVAWQTGFPNEYYFSRLFRQRMGFSPTQWRKAGNPKR
jgi:AraC-like DNA-binding protein